jgi:hypothetical protein
MHMPLHYCPLKKTGAKCKDKYTSIIASQYPLVPGMSTRAASPLGGRLEESRAKSCKLLRLVLSVTITPRWALSYSSIEVMDDVLSDECRTPK